MLSPFTTRSPQILNPTSLSNSTHSSSEDTLWLTIRSTELGFEQVRLFSDFIKRAWNIEENYFINIDLALSEAVMNAIQHGNKEEEEKSVHISAKRDTVFYTFTIKDEGPGFDFRGIQNPTDGENGKKAGGRGIFIMSYLADNLHFTGNGKCANLIFLRR